MSRANVLAPVTAILVDLDDTTVNTTGFLDYGHAFEFNPALINLIVNHARQGKVEVCIITAQDPTIVEARLNQRVHLTHAHQKNIAVERTYAPNAMRELKDFLLSHFQIDVCISLSMASDLFYDETKINCYGYGATAEAIFNHREQGYKKYREYDGKAVTINEEKGKKYQISLALTYLKQKYLQETISVYWFDDLYENILLDNFFTKREIAKELNRLDALLSNPEIKNKYSKIQFGCLQARRNFFQLAVGIDDSFITEFMAFYSLMRFSFQCKEQEIGTYTDTAVLSFFCKTRNENTFIGSFNINDNFEYTKGAFKFGHTRNAEELLLCAQQQPTFVHSERHLFWRIKPLFKVSDEKKKFFTPPAVK